MRVHQIQVTLWAPVTNSLAFTFSGLTAVKTLVVSQTETTC